MEREVRLHINTAFQTENGVLIHRSIDNELDTDFGYVNAESISDLLEIATAHPEAHCQ